MFFKKSKTTIQNIVGKNYQKILLIVLDGFGIATPERGNAITLANPPTLNELVNTYLSTTLQASGPSVGLPWGEHGNSEAGHLNIGTGRIVGQDMPRINAAIEDRTFFKNPAFQQAVEHVKKNNSNLHIVGLLSPGGLHSFDEHCYALLGLAAENGLNNRTFIHVITDGEDTKEPALEAIKKLEERINRVGAGSIATVMGRFYGMDRAEHWNLTEQAYRAMAMIEGVQVHSAEEAVEQAVSQNIPEHMIPPTVVLQKDGRTVHIADNDAIIHFNYRPDRAIQLTRAFTEPNLGKFEKPYEPLKNIIMVTMTEYIDGLNVKVAFAPISLKNGLAEVLSQQGLRQFHCAESEKFAHVSIFFDGGIHAFPGEDREIVTSPQSNYQDYAKVPEMSAFKLTDLLVSKFDQNYAFFLVNFANTDMVGHTGNLQASINAVHAVDECLKKIYTACQEKGICMIVTGDHGNIEELIDIKSGAVDTTHSSNPVPLIIAAEEFKRPQPLDSGIAGLASVIPIGVLSDIAPTILDLYGFPKPAEMTGISLLPQIKP